MSEQFWVDSNGDILTDGSDRPLNCGHDPCCAVCVGNTHITYNAHTSFQWLGDPGPYTDSFNLSFGGATGGPEDKWSGTSTCNGNRYRLNVYCVDEQWLFDLFLEPGDEPEDVNYATPISNTPGGATLVSSGPDPLVDVFGQITTGFYADDFPFCGKTGTFPLGDFLTDFHFHMTLA